MTGRFGVNTNRWDPILNYPGSMGVVLRLGLPRGFGDLGRRAIYFQGAEEHC